MVRKRVYKSKRSASGTRTRYQLWMDIGGSGKRRKGRKRRLSPLAQAWTTITTWLRSTDGGGRRRTQTRRKGWSTGDVHPNLYRRHAQPAHRASVDEVARMRQRRRNRRSR